MAPEKPRLPFHWRFEPVQAAGPISIKWQWKALDHAGREAMASPLPFVTISECIADAKKHGYVEPEER
jgi:hypothetical protein